VIRRNVHLPDVTVSYILGSDHLPIFLPHNGSYYYYGYFGSERKLHRQWAVSDPSLCTNSSSKPNWQLLEPSNQLPSLDYLLRLTKSCRSCGTKPDIQHVKRHLTISPRQCTGWPGRIQEGTNRYLWTFRPQIPPVIKSRSDCRLYGKLFEKVCLRVFHSAFAYITARSFNAWRTRTTWP